VDAAAYELFERLERTHWWLRGRRAVYFGMLDELLPRDGPIESLDVGCGYGAMLPGLGRYGPVTGIDVFEEAIEHCRRRGFERVRQASAYELPAADESLELVTFFDCLEHLDDDLAALREAERVLRPGGAVAISGPAYNFLYANNDRVAHHRRRYTRGQLRSKLEAAGFELRKATYVNTLLFPVILPLVLAKKLRERLFPVADDPTTNLTHAVPRVANEALYRIFAAELVLLRRASFPVGHSVFAFAVKRPQAESTAAAASRIRIGSIGAR
jgi:SAM-dependent methyltransferase